jgi:hypothetical protein
MDINIDEDRFYEAIREGVADAMWKLMTSATDMPCSDFYDSIQAGVKQGIQAGARYTAEVPGDE